MKNQEVKSNLKKKFNEQELWKQFSVFRKTYMTVWFYIMTFSARSYLIVIFLCFKTNYEKNSESISIFRLTHFLKKILKITRIFILRTSLFLYFSSFLKYLYTPFYFYFRLHFSKLSIMYYFLFLYISSFKN